MIGVTAGFTVVMGIIALMCRPGMAIGILIASMMIWPEFLRIPVGPAEMSAPRLIALMLVAKLVASGRTRTFKFTAIDKVIVLMWVWIVIASILSGSDSARTTRFIGMFFDTVLMFYVARLSFRSAEDLRGLAMPLLFVAAYMCFMGWWEASTSTSPYMGLDRYRGWVWIEKAPEYRLGFLRAKTTMSVHIIFGMSMMLMAGIAWALRSHPRIKTISTMAAFFAAAGAFSSMSSGPWIAMILLIICNAYIFNTKLIKPTLYMLFAMALFIEIASNRHFYNLIDYLALNSSTAWYRTRLIEVAASQWRDYWLFGLGNKSIAYWGALLDGRRHVDVVNHFIIVALNGGLAAMFMYMYVHVSAIRHAIKARKGSKDKGRRRALFCLASTLIALDVASLSAGLYGPALLMSNILLGLLTSMALSWQERPVMRPRQQPEQVQGMGKEVLASQVPKSHY